MPTYSVDLHNHTPASADHHQRGEATAHDIVECSLAAGLDVYAATDHLAWGFVADLAARADVVARETGRRLLVVAGTELRVTYRGDEVHITALFDQEGHEQRLAALFGVLGLVGAHLSDEELPHHTFEYDPAEVCRIVDALGGIAIVAHADREFGEYCLIDRPIFGRLTDEPAVSAIDLVDPDGSTPRLSGCGRPLISCSDSHSCCGIGARRTELEMRELSFDALREALSDSGSACADYEDSTLKLA